MTFVGWLYANGHTPSGWQLEIARTWDLNGHGVIVHGGRRYGKTWLHDRWSEYINEATQG